MEHAGHHAVPLVLELLPQTFVSASLEAQIGIESACYAGDLGSISGLGRSPGGGDGNPL